MSQDIDDLRELIYQLQFKGADTLDTFYRFQQAYQEALNDVDGGADGVRRNALSAFVELGELVQELPFKWYRENTDEVDRGAIAMELADVFAFLINVMLHAGVGARDIREGIADTMQKNLSRLESGENR